MVSIYNFKNTKSADMENSQNVNPANIKAHTVIRILHEKKYFASPWLALLANI